ncbi:hypothetical protein B0H14DRAFT_3904789 [Mycena olivaceomarginata]|nr:hypothetical protein B0H14DRAFT_3904789 [Mycena olivaceomarginata]
MPFPKKSIRDRLSHLNGCLPSPKKAIKCVAAIALSPVKHVEKKHRHKDPDDSDHSHGVAGFVPFLTLDSQSDKSSVSSTQHSEQANCEDDDVFMDASPPPADFHMSLFHQGSTPETSTAAPAAFKIVRGRLVTLHRDSSDNISTHTFPAPDGASMLADSDENDSEIMSPEFDELCVPDAGVFSGDGYPRPEPSKNFLQKMAALGKKQFLAAAPDITSAKAALVDMELVLRGPSRGACSGYHPPNLSPWVRIQMEGIWSHLAQYTNQNSVTYGQWGVSACQAAIAAGWGEYCARRFATLSQAYIGSRTVLPINPYGSWKQSMLADEDLANCQQRPLGQLNSN